MLADTLNIVDACNFEHELIVEHQQTEVSILSSVSLKQALTNTGKHIKIVLRVLLGCLHIK